jgi:integrase
MAREDTRMIDVVLRLPGVNTVTETRKNGSIKRRFYYQPDRRRKGIRLPDDPASSAFANAYETARVEWEKTKISAPAVGTFKALIAEYMTSPEYTEKADKTRKDYARFLRILKDLIGEMPVTAIERKHVLALRDRWRDQPRTANYTVQVLRLLLSFSIDRGWRTDNPALRPKLLKTGEGHKPWPATYIERFRGVAPADIRLAFEIGLYTGQREADVLKMCWTDLTDDGGIEVTQRKTGTKLWVPIRSELAAFLATTQRRGILICLTESGRPWKEDHFRHSFRKAVLAADLDGMTFHGLRHTLATEAAEAGANVRALTGHKDDASVRRYTRQADQKRQAKEAVERINRNKP